MAFIRKKRGGSGKLSYQVVESVREGRRVRQRVLACLMYSPTIGEAVAWCEAFCANAMTSQKWRDHYRSRLELLRKVQAETGLP